MKYIPTWMPGSAFKRNALAIRASVDKMFSVPLDQVKREMVSSFSPISCFARVFISRCDRNWVPLHLRWPQTYSRRAHEVQMAKSTPKTNMMPKEWRASCTEVR